jgi:hypothetical protein
VVIVLPLPERSARSPNRLALLRLCSSRVSDGRDLIASQSQPEWPRVRPLWDVTDPPPAGNGFRRAGLRDVRTEWVAALDRVERSTMSREERMTLRWRRCLVKGSTAPNAG